MKYQEIYNIIERIDLSIEKFGLIGIDNFLKQIKIYWRLYDDIS